MCVHTTVFILLIRRLSSYAALGTPPYISVGILVHMCPYTTIYVCSYYWYVLYMCVYTTDTASVLVCGAGYPPLYICRHTSTYVSVYYYICVFILLIRRLSSYAALVVWYKSTNTTNTDWYKRTNTDAWGASVLAEALWHIFGSIKALLSSGCIKALFTGTTVRILTPEALVFLRKPSDIFSASGSASMALLANVPVCVCVYIYIHIYIYISICIYIHIYIYISIYIYVYIYIWIYIYMDIYIYISTYIYIYVYIYTHIYIYPYIYIYAVVELGRVAPHIVYIYVYIYIYLHIYIYIIELHHILSASGSASMALSYTSGLRPSY
jgi:hypothetical protein